MGSARGVIITLERGIRAVEEAVLLESVYLLASVPFP